MKSGRERKRQMQRRQECFLTYCEIDAARKKKEEEARRVRLEKLLLERLEARRRANV